MEKEFVATFYNWTRGNTEREDSVGYISRLLTNSVLFNDELHGSNDYKKYVTAISNVYPSHFCFIIPMLLTAWNEYRKYIGGDN